MLSYSIYQCENPHCGMRFPALEGQAVSADCPHCGSPLMTVWHGELHSEGVGSQQAPLRAPARRLCALLDNIRSAWNVGSIFRTAEGFQFEHLYLGGITPTPDQDKVARTALGAECRVSWSHHRNGPGLVRQCQEQGWKIWVLEAGTQAMPLDGRAAIDAPDVAVPAANPVGNAAKLPSPVVLVVGNEKVGVDPAILDRADQMLAIPTLGVKRSYNVAVAFGIAAHYLRIF